MPVEFQSSLPAELLTFPQLLFHHAKVRPNAAAMREKYLGIWQTRSWSDVAEHVRALASGLAALGFSRGDNLAIIGDNRPHLYMMMSAAQCLGGVPVPMYQDAIANEMHFVLDDAGGTGVRGRERMAKGPFNRLLDLLVLGGQPEHEEQRHHRGDEIRVGDLPGAAVMTMFALCHASRSWEWGKLLGAL